VPLPSWPDHARHIPPRVYTDCSLIVTSSEITVGRLSRDGLAGVLLDVRSPSEYAGGHLPGAVNVPLDKVDEVDAVAARYAGQDVVTVCHSGARSLAAARLLAAAGARVQSLADGTEAWRQAGQPIETNR
jgi:rhodanese-related sulfurtransferase